VAVRVPYAVVAQPFVVVNVPTLRSAGTLPVWHSDSQARNTPPHKTTFTIQLRPRSPAVAPALLPTWHNHPERSLVAKQVRRRGLVVDVLNLVSLFTAPPAEARP
jgi:hypothetical protein